MPMPERSLMRRYMGRDSRTSNLFRNCNNEDVHMKFISVRTRVLGILATAAIAAACGNNPVSVTTDSRNQTVVVDPGAEITVTIQNIGNLLYASPPGVSSPAIDYVG